MQNRTKKLTIAGVIIALIAAVIVYLSQGAASAFNPGEPHPGTCVRHGEYTVPINHAAETHVIHHEATDDTPAYDETVVDKPAWQENQVQYAEYCPDKRTRSGEPDGQIYQVKQSTYNCGDNYQTTTILTTITPYREVAKGVWKLDPSHAVHPRPITVREVHKVVPCHQVHKKHHHKKHHHHKRHCRR